MIAHGLAGTSPSDTAWATLACGSRYAWAASVWPRLRRSPGGSTITSPVASTRTIEAPNETVFQAHTEQLREGSAWTDGGHEMVCVVVDESGRRESNPRYQLGKLKFCH